MDQSNISEDSSDTRLDPPVLARSMLPLAPVESCTWAPEGSTVTPAKAEQDFSMVLSAADLIPIDSSPNDSALSPEPDRFRRRAVVGRYLWFLKSALAPIVLVVAIAVSIAIASSIADREPVDQRIQVVDGDTETTVIVPRPAPLKSPKK